MIQTIDIEVELQELTKNDEILKQEKHEIPNLNLK